jgi:hypothetical protein
MGAFIAILKVLVKSFQSCMKSAASGGVNGYGGLELEREQTINKGEFDLRVAQKREAPRLEPEDLEHKELGCENRQVINKSEAERQEALKNLERFTVQLTVMAHWFEQLKAELKDAYVIIDPERFDSLDRRVRLFCEAADTLCVTLGGRR